MDTPAPSPLDVIGPAEIAESVQWNWLLLTPFPGQVVAFSVVVGLAICLVAWLQPSTNQRALLWSGGGIIAVSMFFWLLIAGLVLWLLRYVRQPGWQRRR